MNLEDCIPYEVVLEKQLQDPEFRKLWDESAFAREVSLKILVYRTERSLTQAEFGKLVGLSQPAVARLEDGEINPTLKLLAKVSAATGLSFHLDVVNGTVQVAA